MDEVPLPRRVPFNFPLEQEEFDRSFNHLMQSRLTNERSKFVPPENVQGYHHGVEWQAHASSYPEDIERMEVHSHESEIKYSDLTEHRVEKIDEFVDQFVFVMHRELIKSIYATVTKSCDRSGNVVSMKDTGSPAAGFIEALRRVEFGVDRHGQPTLPEFHLGSKALEILKADFAKKGPDYELEVEKIKQEKMNEALSKEKERISKFL